MVGCSGSPTKNRELHKVKVNSGLTAKKLKSLQDVNFFEVLPQAAQTLFVIYIRDSIALRFQPFKRMYENGSKIALNSTCSKGLNKSSLP